MQVKSLEVLEYKRILEKLSKMARSGLVKEQILNLLPSSEKTEINLETPLLNKSSWKPAGLTG